MKRLMVALMLGITLLAVPGVARAEIIYATTTGGRLISFDSATPGTIQTNVAISGVAGTLVGIDFRPALPGRLYGLGNSGGVGTVYTIDRMTGAAAPLYTLTSNLNGSSFGVDFNPVPDALRIVSNASQNLRIAGFPTNTFVTNTDGNLNMGGGLVQGIVAAAYTNSFFGTPTTTLYDIQAGAQARLFIQNPPNDGTLNLVGNLGLGTNEMVGFDISFENQAFASLNGGQNFGTIDLDTGAFNQLGTVGGGFAGQITGISIDNSGVPEPASLTLLGLGTAGLLGYSWRRRQTRAAT